MPLINSYLELGKVKITFAVALTTITGYLLGGGSFDSGLILPTLGIFLLACGSSAINHYQERERDALMERTRHRPIPSGRISPGAALAFAFLMSMAGSGLLYIGSGILAMQLGILALIWYNVIYTPLKKKSAFAVVPGAVIGAIPPLVGWVAAGGSLTDPRAMFMAFFFFIWQVPHFWLLMLKYGEEYTKAGYPSITSVYSSRQIKHITFIWILATAVSTLMLPAFNVVESWVVMGGLLISSMWLVGQFTRLLSLKEMPFSPIRYFMKINYFVLAVIIFLSIDRFI
ncbi:MAG TPA: heme o synthase [Bacteroidales bacterium]|nr:heme o synthase [Bacteroidales bacterium]HOX77917.1 heme o synthase [Bacteroidales bacterium]HPI87550.1 heme o synthase [Bacteroidales bacterium]HPM93692.1 heme o synthase [Bacteroidales bacterium]